MNKVYSIKGARDWFLSHSSGSVICCSVDSSKQQECYLYAEAEAFYQSNNPMPKQTTYKSDEEIVSGFIEAYKEAYKDIFTEDVLAMGNPWFHNFILSQRKADREALREKIGSICSNIASVLTLLDWDNASKSEITDALTIINLENEKLSNTIELIEE